MRTGGGDYRRRVVILARVLATADGTGEKVESWPDPTPGTGEHWAKLETASAAEDGEPVRQQQADAVIRFRHKVTLAAVDCVRLKDTGIVYAVTGVWDEPRQDGAGWQTVATLRTRINGLAPS